MPNRPKRFWILIFLLVLAIYGAVVFRGLTESTRRSLLLRSETEVSGPRQYFYRDYKC